MTDEPLPPPPEAAPPEPPPLAPGQFIPLGAIPTVIKALKVPGAIVMTREGQRVQVCAVQVHTPVGMQTFFMDENALRRLGNECLEAAGAGIQLMAANALDALTKRPH